MLRHNGKNLHILGSFTTNVGASPYSFRSAVKSLSLNAAAGIESNIEGSSRRKSSQDEPSAASISSCKSTIALDSKYPFGFDASGGIKFLGRLAPNKPRTPARTDVPLRCMPRTRIQTGRFGRLTEAERDFECLATCRFTNQNYAVSRCTGDADGISIRRARTLADVDGGPPRAGLPKPGTLSLILASKARHFPEIQAVLRRASKIQIARVNFCRSISNQCWMSRLRLGCIFFSLTGGAGGASGE